MVRMVIMFLGDAFKSFGPPLLVTRSAVMGANAVLPSSRRYRTSVLSRRSGELTIYWIDIRTIFITGCSGSGGGKWGYPEVRLRVEGERGGYFDRLVFWIRNAQKPRVYVLGREIIYSISKRSAREPAEFEHWRQLCPHTLFLYSCRGIVTI